MSFSETDQYLMLDGDDGEEIKWLGLKELAKIHHDDELWSMRSTGVIGLLDCPAGRRGAKAGARGKKEVIFARGDAGLRKLVKLGGVPCTACLPDLKQGFWEAVNVTVKKVYGFENPRDFSKKTVLPYDACRVKWEKLAPILGGLPERLYVRPNLLNQELQLIATRFINLNLGIPEVGYYDPKPRGQDRFTAYNMDSFISRSLL